MHLPETSGIRTRVLGKLKVDKKEVFKMTGYEFFASYWWIFPVVMFLLCFFFMRKCHSRRLCGFSEYDRSGASAMGILNKRYAQGEIDQDEYEEKKKSLETS